MNLTKGENMNYLNISTKYGNNRSILTYGGIGHDGLSFFEDTTLFVEKHQGNIRFFEQIKKDYGHLTIGVVSIACLINQETKEVKTWTNPRLKEQVKKLKIEVA